MKKNKELDNKIVKLFKKYNNKFKKIGKYYEPIGKGYDIGMHLSDDEYEYLQYHYFGYETSIYVFFKNHDKDIDEIFKLYNECQDKSNKFKPKHWSYYFDDYLLPKNFKKSNDKNNNKTFINYVEYKGPKLTKNEMKIYLNTYYICLKKHNLINNFKIRVNFPKKTLVLD